MLIAVAIHTIETPSLIFLSSILFVLLSLLSLESMAGEISDIMDSLSLTDDDETQCVGQPQTMVELRINSCKFNVFMVVYGR